MIIINLIYPNGVRPVSRRLPGLQRCIRLVAAQSHRHSRNARWSLLHLFPGLGLPQHVRVLLEAKAVLNTDLSPDVRAGSAGVHPASDAVFYVLWAEPTYESLLGQKRNSVAG